jgi:hypothetical protein
MLFRSVHVLHKKWPAVIETVIAMNPPVRLFRQTLAENVKLKLETTLLVHDIDCAKSNSNR